MSLSTYVCAPGIATDALFRAALSPLGVAIQAVGWVKTPDTGQINWTTVTKPTLADTVAGYEMFRMADSLQSTAPVYMKIESGTGGAATYASRWITIGTGTDGAGNLTGVIGTRIKVECTSTAVTTDMCYVDGDSSRLVFCLWPVVALSAASFYSVERTHDGTGADTGVGVMWLCGTNPVKTAQWLVLNGGTILPPFTASSCVIVPSGSGFYGSDYALFPIRWFSPGETVPSKNVCCCVSTDIATGTVLTANVWYGGTASFYTTPVVSLELWRSGQVLDEE